MNDHDKKLWELTKKYMGKKHGYNYMRELRDIFLDDDPGVSSAFLRYSFPMGFDNRGIPRNHRDTKAHIVRHFTY